MFVTPLPPDIPPAPPAVSSQTVRVASAGLPAAPVAPATLTAQAGTPPTPTPTATAVAYNGTTLAVDGQIYPRATGSAGSERGYAPGRLLVSPQPGRGGEIAPLMARLGLTVERPLGGDPPIGWVINVPAGFELQWQAALKRQPAVAAADVDGRMSTQPVRPGAMPAGPGVVR
jgi:hypothetical protein